MENPLETYQRILFIDLRPWLLSNDSELKYRQQLVEASKEYYSVQPSYELDFTKPMAFIRKYFAHLIDSTAIRFLNFIHSEMAAAINDTEKRYLINTALNRMLVQKLKETSGTIAARNYTPEQFDVATKIHPDQVALSNESYILHYLKHQLVRLVMEIQAAFSDYLKEAPLTEEDVYYSYFHEPAPAKSFIIKAEKRPSAKPVASTATKPHTTPFNAIKNDIRTEKKGIYTYEQIIKNSSRFAQIEEELYQHGYLDDGYNFTDQHGQKQFLAAFYHQLIRKGYFNKRAFPGNVEIKSLHIRKFLDHRYNADVDKQFRNWENDKVKLAVFIEKDYWLDRIIAS